MSDPGVPSDRADCDRLHGLRAGWMEEDGRDRCDDDDVESRKGEQSRAV